MPEGRGPEERAAARDAARCAITFGNRTHEIDPERPFRIGREGDLALHNPYLHRAFLEIRYSDGLWWLVNIGSRLSATVTDAEGSVQASLNAGGRLPLLFGRTSVVFTAGTIAYSLVIVTSSPVFRPIGKPASVHSTTTYGSVVLTTSQRALIVALSEPLLRREGATVSEIPSSAAAARRLGWTQTRFNRKLDNVCDKLDAIGVSGVRGSPGRAAMQRRARLVEYAVTTRLVTAADLPLLDRPIPDHPDDTGGEDE